MRESRQTPLEALGVSRENAGSFFEVLAKRIAGEEVDLSDLPEDVVVAYHRIVESESEQDAPAQTLQERYIELVTSLAEEVRGDINQLLDKIDPGINHQD